MSRAAERVLFFGLGSLLGQLVPALVTFFLLGRGPFDTKG